jgi:1-acyl-sn-glycerol-3-phosphate acyltransferase
MAFRSALFNALFYALMIVMMIACAPAMLFGRRAALACVTLFSRAAMALHRVVTGIRHEVRGFDTIPRAGAIVAMKHQSTWETLALFPYIPEPVFVLKKELMAIPVFGWWCRVAGMIPVDRSGGVSALNAMTRMARDAVAAGRQVVIFPEGTRRDAGAPPDYKLGIAHLYKDLGVPMIPVALNSGLFWPRRSMVHARGTIVAEALPAIPPALDARQAFRRMRDEIEAACDRLLVEAARDGATLTPAARARVEAIGAGVSAAP